MAARLTKKNSAFLAFQQAELDFDSDGSEDERALMEQKEKQKAKKKSSKKKKSSESSSLKELAMLPVSAGKKSKAKGKSGQSQQTTSEHEEEEATTSPQEDEWALVQEERPSSSQAVRVQSNPKAAKSTHSAPASNRPAPGSVAAIGALSSARPASTPVPPAPASAPVSASAPAFAARTTAPTPQPKEEAKSPRKPPSPPPRAPSPHQARPQTQPQAPQQPEQQAQPPNNGQKDLGAIYSPTHITVTRADGQVSRKIGVAEMMDQLVRFQHHNSQLTLANRSLQEQRQRDANIIATLQNDVNLFRQMCLTLQAEASQLRTLAASAMNMRQASAPSDAPLNGGQPPYGRGSRPAPPPGMS